VAMSVSTRALAVPLCLTVAGHPPPPVPDHDVGFRAPQRLRGDLLGLALDLPHLLEDRGETDGRGARAVGAHTELHLVGVAMDDRDLADGNAEAIRNELGERRLVALAVAVRTGQYLDGADRVDAHLR